ncbi:MAG TPA: sugar phosphate isomerase/epimerase [Granulicella sp.]|jgi:sugar phosphate isomerase/epimerase
MKNSHSLSNRRTFLRSGAAIAAAGCLPTGAALALAAPTATPDKPSPVRLGLTSYTFRTLTRAQLIATMKTLKLTLLNCKDAKDHLPMSSLDEEKAALADYAAAGITVTAVGAVYFKEDTDEAFRKNFEYAKAAGVKVIVAGDPAPTALPRLEKFVKEYDIKIAIHNHGPEDKLWPSPLTVLAAVKNLDPRIGCCIDVGHTMRAGTDVVAAIHKVGPRLFDVHMKDLAQPNVKESQVAVGEGIMPVRGIFQALIDIKYPGNVDLEYEIFPDNPIPGATESFAYMRGVLAGMGYKA